MCVRIPLGGAGWGGEGLVHSRDITVHYEERKFSFLYLFVFLHIPLYATFCTYGVLSKTNYSFFVYFFGGLEYVGHSFAYVSHL
jgi:hypothetical protein